MNFEEYDPRTIRHDENMKFKEWKCENIGILYLPKSNEKYQDGTVLDFTPSLNGKLIMNKENLFRRLDEKDNSVKFVQFGYKIDELEKDEISNHQLILALGSEKTKRIKELSDNHIGSPYLWSFNSVPEERTAMFYLGHDLQFGKRLILDCRWKIA